MRRPIALLSLACAAALGNAQQLPLEVVAITGRQAPGMAPGVVFSELGVQNFPGTTSIHGTVAFLAKVSGPGISTANNTTLWLVNAGAPQLIRQTGPDPFTPGATIMGFFGPFAIDGHGGVVYFRDSTPALTALYYWGASGEQLVFPYDAVPSLPAGHTIYTVGAPRISQSGSIAMFCRYRQGTGPIQCGYWTGREHPLAFRFGSGMQAPGLDPGVIFAEGMLGDYTRVRGEDVTFLFMLHGAGVTPDNNLASWTLGSGPPELVMRKGAPAPGLPPGAVTGGLDFVFPAAGGALGIGGTLVGPGYTSLNDGFAGLWLNGVSIAIREGDEPPGLPGLEWGRSRPPFSVGNWLLFNGWVRGPGVNSANNEVYYVGSAGALRLVARTGEPVPGTPAGVTLAQNPNSAFPAPCLNARGDLVFPALLAGPSVTTANDEILLVTRADGAQWLLAREGVPFIVAPGDERVVADILAWGASNGRDGHPTSLDDDGRVVFTVKFADGTSGLFRFTIPELPCYPDCNGDGALNLADFGCFQTRFALADPYADCNGDGALNLADFGCFQTKFALGCP